MYKRLLFLLCLMPLISQAQSMDANRRLALVDTGYDMCMATSGKNCEKNKNLLFRGNQPLDESEGYSYQPDRFREAIYAYLQDFKQIYDTKAEIPQSLSELNQYRIVIINLLYDWEDHGSNSEYDELAYEFKNSGASTSLQIPEQHKIYRLESVFDQNTYAFEWWPITLPGEDPHHIAGNINWPNNELFVVPRSNQFYKPMNLPYLITGISYDEDKENNAIDLLTLLVSQPNDGHPLLIYYHCVAGKDRTGAVTLSYLMQHGGYGNTSSPPLTRLTRHQPASFFDAYRLVTQANYSLPKEEALKTGQSYCLSLNKTSNDCER